MRCCGGLLAAFTQIKTYWCTTKTTEAWNLSIHLGFRYFQGSFGVSISARAAREAYPANVWSLLVQPSAWRQLARHLAAVKNRTLQHNERFRHATGVTKTMSLNDWLEADPR